MLTHAPAAAAAIRLLVVLPGGPRWPAGVQYARHLIRGLGLLPASERPRVVLAVPPANRGRGYEEEFARVPFVEIDRFAVPALRRLALSPRGWWRLFGLRSRRSDDCTVAFPVKGPRPRRGPAGVAWVPDFQYKHLPEYFPAGERRARDQAYAELFRRSRFLLVTSQAVRRDLGRFFPGHDHLHVRVVPFAATFPAEELAPDPAAACRRLGLPERFAYLPGQFWRHKGHDTVAAALWRLRQQGLRVPLVCSGSPRDYRDGGGTHAGFLGRVAATGLADQVAVTGFLPRADQVAVLRQAALVVQPSLFEGWSTAVEEARALGKPLVVSDLAVHKEQDPPRARYFPAGDSRALAELLSGLWPRARAGPAGDEPAALARGRERARAFARAFVALVTLAHESAVGCPRNRGAVA